MVASWAGTLIAGEWPLAEMQFLAWLILPLPSPLSPMLVIQMLGQHCSHSIPAPPPKNLTRMERCR